MPEIQATAKDFYAIRYYEVFRLSQPHIVCLGLFEKGGWYHIVCPGVDENTLALDGTLLQSWFERNRFLASPIRLQSDVPSEATEIPSHTLRETIRQKGHPLTTRDAFSQLVVSLPAQFPIVALVATSETKPWITIQIPRDLSEDETSLLSHAVLDLGVSIAFRTEVVDSSTPAEQPRPPRSNFRRGDIDVVVSKMLPSTLPRRLRQIVEDDEEFWRDKRDDLLATNMVTPARLIERGLFRKNACLLDATVMPPPSLRVLLTLYDHVFLALPLATHLEAFSNAAKVTVSELSRLAEEGKLTICLPQPIHKYPLQAIERIVESSEGAVISSRRLAALSVVASRRRFPLLYAPLSIDDRVSILSSLAQLRLPADESETNQAYRILTQLVRTLSRIWQTAEDLLSARGALGAPAVGLGSLLADFLQYEAGKDLWLETFSATAGVEWAAGLNADIVPSRTENYDEYPLSCMLACLYSGINRFPVLVAADKAEILVDGVLGVDGDISYDALTHALGSADRSRLREVVRGYQEGTKSREEMEQAVRLFNREVIKIERRSEKLSRLDLSGLIAGAAGIATYFAAARNPAALGIASVPLALWVASRLAGAKQSSETIGAFFDGVRSLVLDTTLDAVFVARLRKQLGGKT